MIFIQSHTKANRRMIIQPVGNDKAALGYECGNDRGVGRKVHQRNENVLLATSVCRSAISHL